MIGLFVTVDTAPVDLLSPQAICEQVQYSPLFPRGAAFDLTVSIEGSTYLVVDPPSHPHVMNQWQRDALERAFWQSVEILDDGYEA